VNRRLDRATVGALLALCLAGPLAACGKKDAPAVPKGQTNTYPRAYPYDPSKPAKTPDAGAFPSIGPDDSSDKPIQPQSPE